MRPPRPGVARHGIAKGRSDASAGKAREHLGQPVSGQFGGRVDDALRDAGRGLLMGVAAKASGDDRVVVWPDGAQVVADRVVPCLTLGEVRTPQPLNMWLSSSSRAVAAARSTLAMPDHNAWPGSEVFTAHGCPVPWSASAYPIWSSIQKRSSNAACKVVACCRSSAAPDIPVAFEQFGDTKLRLVHVALHLDQRDRGLGHVAAFVDDGVARVLPPRLPRPWSDVLA